MNRKNDFLKISYQHWSGMNQEKEELLIFLVFNANYEIIAEHRCCLASVSQSDPLRTEVGCLRGSVGPSPGEVPPPASVRSAQSCRAGVSSSALCLLLFPEQPFQPGGHRLLPETGRSGLPTVLSPQICLVPCFAFS